MNTHPRLPLSGILLGLLSTAPLMACASGASQVERDEPLPLHVVLLPIRDVVLPEKKGGGMSLNIDGERLLKGLREALDGKVFTRVTFSRPSGGDDLDETRGLVKDARERGADLLLECELSYKPTIWRERNTNVFVGLLLYTLGGPLGALVKEFTYKAEARLDCSFLDLWVIDDEADDDEFRLSMHRADVGSFHASFSGVNMNLVDRADGVKDYAYAVVVPATFLAKENDKLEDRIGDRVVESLIDQLAKDVRSNRSTLLRSGDATPFRFNPDGLVPSLGDGKVHVSGTVELLANQVVERMARYRIWLGSRKAAEGEFKADEPKAGDVPNRVYSFSADLPLKERDDTLRLELEAGTRDRFVRSYTYLLGTKAGEK